MELIVFAPKLGTPSSGGWRLDAKFASGVDLMAKYWDGPVTVMLSEGLSTSLSTVEYDSTRHPFAIEPIPSADSLQRRLTADTALMAPLRWETEWLTVVTGDTTLVWVTDHSPLTRLQAARTERETFITSLRSTLGAAKKSVSTTRTARRGDGIHCNGTPAYEYYLRWGRNPLLFFGSRVPLRLMPSADSIRPKITDPGGKPTLVFSGRLERIKGVHLIPDIALELKRLALDFEWHILGDGSLKSELLTRLRHLALDDVVTLHSPKPFTTAWVPWMIEEATLFVCPHLQSDPSSTFLETLSCGVPIVSFPNTSLRGMQEYCPQAIRLSHSREPRELARLIAQSCEDRQRLLVAAGDALHFAKQHSVEEQMKSRVSHIDNVARKKQARS